MTVTIARTDLEREAASKAFGFLFAVRDAGKEDGAGNLVIDSALLARIEWHYRGGQPAARPQLSRLTPERLDALAAARKKSCDACAWNQNELCQHIGCKVCPGKAKNSGGLAAMQRNPFSTCPTNQWSFT